MRMGRTIALGGRGGQRQPDGRRAFPSNIARSPARRCSPMRSTGFAPSPRSTQIQVVIGGRAEDALSRRRSATAPSPRPIIGGATRRQSVRNGLEALAGARARADSRCRPALPARRRRRPAARRARRVMTARSRPCPCSTRWRGATDARRDRAARRPGPRADAPGLPLRGNQRAPMPAGAAARRPTTPRSRARQGSTSRWSKAIRRSRS